MLKGIDVSYANGSINWSQVRKNIDFAIIRSTFGLDLEGQTDEFFTQNADGCVKYNIPFGTYHFAYFTDKQSAIKQAEFAIRKANQYKNHVKFIALDIEEDSETYAKRIGKSPNWTNCAITFLETVKKAGYIPILYTNQDWLTNYLDYNKMKNYKIWFAAPGATSPKYNAILLQYSWTGTVPGITGKVDMNYLYDETLIKKSATTKNTATTTSSTTKTTTTTSDKTKFLNQAKTYIGVNGNFVCNTKLKIGGIYDWCAYSISSIMKDCGFIGKYINAIQGGAGDIPRYSDGKYGTWFKKGAKAPQSGDLIFFRYGGTYSDKYHSDHVGIVEAVSGNTITTLEGNVDGNNSNWAATSIFKRKTRYLTTDNVYAFYRPNWKTTTVTTTSTTTANKTSNSTTTIDVTYQVYANGKWLPEVKNLEDYAGLENKPIQGIYMKPSKGHLRYRVKLVGSNSYLPWVVDKNDYAGILGKNIDCIQAELTDCAGYVVQYRVSTTSSQNYLNWITNYNTTNDMGYSGIKNSSIDKLQIKIVKK